MPAKNVSNSEHFCKTIASRYASSPYPQTFLPFMDGCMVREVPTKRVDH